MREAIIKCYEANEKQDIIINRYLEEFKILREQRYNGQVDFTPDLLAYYHLLPY